MLNRFLRQLLGRTPVGEPLSGEAADHALAVLLVRLARADGAYDAEERGHILNLLARRGGLSHAEADAQLVLAEATESEAADTVRFTRDIKDRVPLEERVGIVQELWALALTDTHRDPGEDQLLRLVVSLLGVSDQDSARARQRAAAELGLR